MTAISAKEKRALRIIDYVAEPRVAQAAKMVQALAARQGGKTMRENYELLGKRAFCVGAIAAAGVAVAVVAGGVAIGRAIASHAAKREAEEPLEDDTEGDCSLVLARSGLEAPRNHRFYRNYGKRALDLAIGTAALPVVALTTAACGAAIKLEDGGPVFYNAPRVGKDGRLFIMYKLRSMKVNAPDLVMEDGSTYNGADDPRMTKVGAFMRKTSLDEIPQFLNVLKGDMSVVGPRPDLKREVELYRGEEPLKLTVKPGVTGYAAVYGRNALPWHERLALDVEYVKRLSFPLDARIFFRTFSTVFNQEGIYVEDADEGRGSAAAD